VNLGVPQALTDVDTWRGIFDFIILAVCIRGIYSRFRCRCHNVYKPNQQEIGADFYKRKRFG